MSIAATWFAALGAPLAHAARADIDVILAGLGIERRIDVAVVADWPALARALWRVERDDDWWQVEEGEREQLWYAAAATLGESALEQAIATATDAARDDVSSAVAAAMARSAIVDPVLGDAARAAALLAIHHDALATLAGAGATHPFVRKRALFAAGRWPLGCHAGRYLVF